MKIEIFLHRRAERIDVITVDSATAVTDLALGWVGAEALVWLEDAEKCLDPELTLEVAGVSAHCHLHVSTCRGVAVKVRYNGALVERSVPPAMTVGAVLNWAAGPDGFKLTDAEIAKHELAICGTETGLDQAKHIGSIADDDCSVCLDLRPKDRFAG